ncbi:MAG: TldD/PmbA family protein [Thermoproteota archaeon]
MPGVTYSDRVEYSERVVEVAYRGGSVELNFSRASVSGVRYNVDGCWGIVSVQGGRLAEALERAKKVAERLARSGGCGGFAEAELFSGRVALGRHVPEADALASLLAEYCRDAEQAGARVCEAYAAVRETFKRIERDYGGSAEEERRLIEVDVGLLGSKPYGGSFLASSYTASLLWSEKDAERAVESAFRDALRELAALSKHEAAVFPMGPIHVVLGGRATGALIHEVSHLVDASNDAARGVLGAKISSEDLEIYDSPHEPGSPSSRFFDDEGVATRKRYVVESGRVVDLHHTRATASALGSRPGSAYGLFHRPVGFHSTLVVRQGDWRDEEIVEETSRGIYVEDAAYATLEEGVVRIVPLKAYAIERGELARRLRVRAVKIPLGKLRTVSAVSKRRVLRVSRERDWIVAEYAPALRLEAYVE